MMSTPIPITIQDYDLCERHGEQYFVCRPLEQAGFTNAFSTRTSGTAAKIENRERFLATIGVPDWKLVTARQVHSADVRLITAVEAPQVCDALISATPQILLGIQTADCLPILLCDERTGAIAAIHAGWRGTLRRIVARTLEAMQHAFGSTGNDIRVAIGPGLLQCCFEVGPEVEEAFSAEFDYVGQLFTRNDHNTKAHLDIIAGNVSQLVDSGVSQDRIYSTGLCTVCRNDLLFSHRKERGAERPVGRMLGVIGR
jgi:YfiH family protein